MGDSANTDTLDGEVIALFAERVRPQHGLFGNLEGPPAELVVRRREIIEMIGMETNRAAKPSTSLLPES